MERERGASAEWVLPTPFCLEKHAIGFNRWQLCVVCSDLVTASVGFGPLATIVTTLFSLWGRGCSVAFDSGNAVQAWQWWGWGGNGKSGELTICSRVKVRVQVSMVFCFA
jgi:hypothetical protein